MKWKQNKVEEWERRKRKKERREEKIQKVTKFESLFPNTWYLFIFFVWDLLVFIVSVFMRSLIRSILKYRSHRKKYWNRRMITFFIWFLELQYSARRWRSEKKDPKILQNHFMFDLVINDEKLKWLHASIHLKMGEHRGQHKICNERETEEVEKDKIYQMINDKSYLLQLLLILSITCHFKIYSILWH